MDINQNNFDEAISFVDKNGGTLISLIRDTFIEYISLNHKKVSSMSNSSKASTIRDLILGEIEMNGDRYQGMEVLRKGNQAFIWSSQGFLIRVKKLKLDYTPSYNPTKSTRNFDKQFELEGFPVAKNLYLGYITDDFGLKINEIILVSPYDEGKIEWVIDIEKTVAENITVVNFIDIPENTESMKEKRFKITGRDEMQYKLGTNE